MSNARTRMTKGPSSAFAGATDAIKAPIKRPLAVNFVFNGGLPMRLNRCGYSVIAAAHQHYSRKRVLSGSRLRVAATLIRKARSFLT